MSYPKSFIDEIKYKNNITDVIGRFVTLKKSGSNMSGLCPFHSERSPSFTVFGDHYHCFGCGAGGDVITFVMQMEGMSYPDALKSLADRAGIPVPTERGNEFITHEKKPVLSRDRGFALNKAAARIFHANLALPDAAEARDYLERRALSSVTIRHFGIGFALNSFDDLLCKLRSQGFTDEEIKEGSLCGISQKGKYYDYFRNRVMFPIIDTQGNVVAFGGRVMDDSKPKYLNSSDTPVFKKSRTLFALNFAKDAALGDKKSDIAGKLIMCEGYMDVIALHQAGFCNAVATLGTAVTSEHARIISRYAKTVFLAYDSDTAGQNATRKAIQLLTEAGIESKALKITGAKDPDEFIKTFGGAAFSKLMGGALGQIDYSIGEILGKYDMNIPDDKVRAVDEACAMLSGIFPIYRREVYISRLSEVTGVSKASIENEIKRKELKQRKTDSKVIISESEKKMRRYSDNINKEAVMHPRAVGIEESILGILMLYPELIPNGEVLSADDFVTNFSKRLFIQLNEMQNRGEFDISLLNEFYKPDEMSRIVSMLENRRMLTSNGKEALNEQIKSLKNEKAELSATDFESRMANIKKQKGNTSQ